jgi:hypothetical protein
LVEIPNEAQILSILDKSEHRWFMSDGPTYIFNSEVRNTIRVSSVSCNVEVRTYEVHDLTLSDLLRPGEIMVWGYKIVFVILFNEANRGWEVEGAIDGIELKEVEMSALPDSVNLIDMLINRVGDEIIEWSEPEELMRVDTSKIHSSLRKILSKRSSA